MASAKRRVEMALASKAKLQTTPHVQINTHVDDPQKSLEELFTAGVRTHERKLYERRKNIPNSIPVSFNQRPVSIKSRGSSAGHSRECSSDDGIGSSGQHTLSPSSITSANFSSPYHGSVHTRQGSAPALINYSSSIEHQSHRPPPAPMHTTSKSLSITTMSDSSNQYNISSHRAAKSCDLDAQSNRTIEQPNFAPEGQPFYVDHHQKVTYWSDPRGKSQSLDPMTIRMNTNPPMEQQTMVPMHQHEVVDNLGPLPQGWMKSYDHNGDPYFIDHIHQATTWYDPRIPHHLQEEKIKQRHGRNDDTEAKCDIYDNTKDHTSSLVQQLQLERRGMQERQEQLYREGLIEPQYQFQSNLSNINQHAQHVPNYSNYSMPQAQQMPSDLLTPNYYCHNKNTSNDSALDNPMEIDYVASNHIGMTNMPTNNQIVPSLVRDLTAQDLNPRDFDQYLQLNDHRSSTATKQFM